MTDMQKKEDDNKRKLNDNFGLYFCVFFFVLIFFGAIVFEVVDK